ncbi:cbb3-type cytochrome oxidase assembly protein CcoS [Vitellibacter sp. q18]|nr:cbb3-type cytochrome oxidase assembly protein CcoS [Aequorivita lutea]
MTIIYMLLAISVFVALIFFVLFIYSVKKGQYDDTYTPSVRMLFEDELVKDGSSPSAKKSTQNKTNPKTQTSQALE